MLCLCTVPGNTQVLLLPFLPKLTTAAKQEILLAMSKAPPKWKPHESLQKWSVFFWKTVLLMLRCTAQCSAKPDWYQKSLFCICCLSVPPYGSLSSIPLSYRRRSWRKIFLLFKGKVQFSRVLGLWGASPLFHFLPSFKSSIFIQPLLPSSYSYHSSSFGCYYHLIAEKEWNFNKRELWYRKHTRKLPPLRRTRTEAKWGKGSD